MKHLSVILLAAGIGYELAKIFARHDLLFAGAVIVVIVLIVGAVHNFVQAVKYHRSW